MSEREGGYKQHGSRHGPHGSDPIPGIGVGGGTFQGCRLNQAGAQAVPNNALTPVTFDAVEFDVGGLYDTLEPGVMSIQADGVYGSAAYVQWASNGTGIRRLQLDISTDGGSTYTAYWLDNRMAVTAGGWTTEQGVMAVADLHAGDKLRISCWQTSGGSLNVSASINAWVTFLISPLS